MLDLLKDFYDYSNIPLSVYNEKEYMSGFGDFPAILDRITHSIIGQSEGTDSPLYLIHAGSIFYGIIRQEETGLNLLVGPVINHSCTIEESRKILVSFNLHEENLKSFNSYINSLAIIDLGKFLSLLRFLDTVINKTEGREPEILESAVFESDEAQTVDFHAYMRHMPEEIENRMLAYIEQGKTLQLEDEINDKLFSRGSVPVNNIDYDYSVRLIFASSVALASSAAVRGGVPYDTAYAMREYYLAKIKENSSITSIGKSFKRMLLSFAAKAADIQSLKSNSSLVIKINKQIHSQIYEKISPTIIAEKMSMNVSYLCRHFKSQTGKTINEYINEVKIKEVKMLLLTTDASLLDISLQLGFSSQSHFQTLFKKQAGCTPSEYRRKHNYL